jgi:hypothetical protein
MAVSILTDGAQIDKQFYAATCGESVRAAGTTVVADCANLGGLADSGNCTDNAVPLRTLAVRPGETASADFFHRHKWNITTFPVHLLT